MGEFRRQASAAEFLPRLYDELRRLAGWYVKNERPDHTLQPTALVHEAYLKLAGSGVGKWKDAVHFRTVAANAMRQILVDHAKKRHALKRGGDLLRVTLDEGVVAEKGGMEEVDLLHLDRAIEELTALDDRKGRVVELRFFGGLKCAEVAQALSVSPKTVEADWYMARAWLRQRLDREG